MYQRANDYLSKYLRNHFRRRNLPVSYLGSFVHDAQASVAAQVKTPPGYFITWGGQFENQQKAVRRLLIAIPISLLLVFVLIYACFNSLRNTLTIIFNIPIALVGSTMFLLISGFPLSVPAIVGFIAVFGVAVQNGMVMVSYINKLRNSGMELNEAVITGASVRLRAELLSALIGSISLIPFIISSGTGAEIEKLGDRGGRRIGDTPDQDRDFTNGIRVGRAPRRSKVGDDSR